MFRDHIVQALRSFEKNKVHTLINIFGLSLGLTASMLVFLFVRDELSFDRFHANSERLYRLNKINTQVDGSTSLNAESSGLMGPTMVDEFPEVEKVVRYQPWYDDIVLSYKDKNVLTKEQELVFADSTFFEVFSFTLLHGDFKKALSRPSTMVLTEKTAKALFGNENAIGKVVKGMHGVDFEITGIAADPPRNSHIQFAGIMSWSTTVPQVGPLEFTFLNNWISQALCTYVLLKEGTNQKNVEAKFQRLMMDHLPERADKYALYLQPFKDIYLKSHNI
jgi:putative ABC transport system permease protein